MVLDPNIEYKINQIREKVQNDITTRLRLFNNHFNQNNQNNSIPQQPLPRRVPLLRRIETLRSENIIMRNLLRLEIKHYL